MHQAWLRAAAPVAHHDSGGHWPITAGRDDARPVAGRQTLNPLALQLAHA